MNIGIYGRNTTLVAKEYNTPRIPPKILQDTPQDTPQDTLRYPQDKCRVDDKECFE